MTELHQQSRLRVLVLVMLIALTSHLILEGAAIASTDHAGADADIPSSITCVHTGILLPAAATLLLAFALHFMLTVSQPVSRGYRAPAPLHPPTGLSFC